VPINLEPLMVFLPGWLMVLFRIIGIFLAAPVFSRASIPRRIKVLLAVGLSFCVYPMLHPILWAPGGQSAALLMQLQGPQISLPRMAGAVASELLIGVVLGLGAGLPIAGMQLAGQMIDQQLGTGLGGLINPDQQQQTTAVSQTYYLMATMFFLALGGHRVLMMTLLDSYHAAPLGGFHMDGRVLGVVLGLLTAMLELALRVAAPVLGLVFLESVAMGFVARTVPQLNILTVGFPLRLVMGMALIAGAVVVQSGVFAESVRQTLVALRGIVASP
jgi:flagellar biosynthetic protein FliR